MHIFDASDWNSIINNVCRNRGNNKYNNNNNNNNNNDNDNDNDNNRNERDLKLPSLQTKWFRCPLGRHPLFQLQGRRGVF